jgi:transcriptional accessory protein Tex/SPT6
MATGWEKAAKASKQKQSMAKKMAASKTRAKATAGAAKTLKAARREMDSTIARNPELRAKAERKYMAAAVAATTLPKKKFKFATGPGTGKNSHSGSDG